jgi:hypothetical protein
MTEVNSANEINNSVPTEEEKIKFLQEFQQPTGGHLGMDRTFERIKFYISWPGMKQEIENYVIHHEICQRNKITQKKTNLPLHFMDTPEAVWQNSSSLDILGSLTQTSENRKYLMIFQDELSKFTEAVPTPQQDAMT